MATHKTTETRWFLVGSQDGQRHRLGENSFVGRVADNGCVARSRRRQGMFQARMY